VTGRNEDSSKIKSQGEWLIFPICRKKLFLLENPDILASYEDWGKNSVAQAKRIPGANRIALVFASLDSQQALYSKLLARE
jgi:hypothetical protein